MQILMRKVKKYILWLEARGKKNSNACSPVQFKASKIKL